MSAQKPDTTIPSPVTIGSSSASSSTPSPPKVLYFDISTPKNSEDSGSDADRDTTTPTDLADAPCEKQVPAATDGRDEAAFKSSAGPHRQDLHRQKDVETARVVSYLSVVACACMGVAGIVIGIVDDSLSLVGIGVESFLDMFTSVLVLWRFGSGCGSGTPEDRLELFDSAEDAELTLRHRDQEKERAGSKLMAVLFIAMGAALAAKSVYKLVLLSANTDMRTFGDDRDSLTTTVTLSLLCVIIFGIFAWVKSWLAKRLQSKVLSKDGLSSFLTMVMAAVVALGSLAATVSFSSTEDATDNLGDAWHYVDPSLAILIAVVLSLDGARTLCSLPPSQSV